jgi:hypothetical protein
MKACKLLENAALGPDQLAVLHKAFDGAISVEASPRNQHAWDPQWLPMSVAR